MVDPKRSMVIWNGFVKYLGLDWAKHNRGRAASPNPHCQPIQPTQFPRHYSRQLRFRIGSDRRHKKLSSPSARSPSSPSVPWYTMLLAAATAAAPDHSCSPFSSSRRPAPPGSLLLARRATGSSSGLSLRRHGLHCHCRCRCHALWSNERERRGRGSRGRHCR